MNIFLKVAQLDTPHSGFSYNDISNSYIDLHDFFILDVDNFSDRDLVQKIIQVIAENEKTIFFIEMSTKASTGTIPYLLRGSLKYKGKVTIIYKGQHKALERLIEPFSKLRFEAKISNNYLMELINH